MPGRAPLHRSGPHITNVFPSREARLRDLLTGNHPNLRNARGSQPRHPGKAKLCLLTVDETVAEATRNIHESRRLIALKLRDGIVRKTWAPLDPPNQPLFARMQRCTCGIREGAPFTKKLPCSSNSSTAVPYPLRSPQASTCLGMPKQDPRQPQHCQ